MRSSLIFSVFLFSLIIFKINARDILDEEEARDVQRYCEKYASCRKSARQQFEKCAGGFSKMILAQTDSLRIKPSSRSEKCEKQLLLNIGSQIKPAFEKIEQDTFECTKSADPHAFNLDQSQTLICKAIQQEVGLDNFAINGAQSDLECRNTFESQMQRCDLVKECCPQFTHCHTKAELENNIYGKEERLAGQLDECIGYKRGSPKDLLSGTSGTYKHEDTRKAPPATTTSEPSTTAAAAPTASTFPPPDKVFSDLFKALFPGLAPPTPLSTTNPSTTTTIAEAETDSSAESTEATTTESLYEKVNKIIKKESGETEELPPLSQTSQWKSSHQKLEQIKSKEKSTDADYSKTSSSEPFPTPSTTKAPFEIDFSYDSLPSYRRSSRIHSAPLISKDSIAYDENQKEALSRVYCENLIECDAVVERQFDLCDTRYQPEENLYGIEKQSLRAQFLSNSNVTDQKVKRRCLEAVDPESQRQLLMLETLVQEQIQKCTRKAQIPSITSDKFEQCQNVHLISIISEMFTNKDIADERSTENAERCYARVGQLQTICDTLRKCCPQHDTCTNGNHSSEGAKYRLIVDQLKEEQTLCEKRRMRILNGLV
uniref:Uncharacterized protein n=1 Tax=Panagrolaimus sp. PS1159 TaxID=55785 RepID=A0AC35FBW5_9BILA